jgi:hypothetical protein
MKTVSHDAEERGRPWPAPNVNGSPGADGQWWCGSTEPFPLWPAAETRETPIVPAPLPAPAPAPPPAAVDVEAAPAKPVVSPVRQTRQPTTPVPRRDPRHPAVGLAALVVFALLAGFFSWVSAEPFWLSMGRGKTGTATVSSCTGSGVLQRCLVTVQAAGFQAERVTLVGAQGTKGETVQARVVGADARIAYAGDSNGLHLRWLIGLGLVLLCGLGIAWGMGTNRLPTRRTRLAALGTSVAAPLLLFVATLIATW